MPTVAPESIEPLVFVRGCPAHRLLGRLHLLRGDQIDVRRCVVALLGITLGPLIALSIVEGTAWGDASTRPLVSDWIRYARLAVLLPLMVLAESVADEGLAATSRHFVRNGLIDGETLGDYRDLVARISAKRFALLPGFVTAAIAGALTWWWANQNLRTSDPSWFATITAAGPELTAAGTWAAVVAAFYRYLILRWLWRILLWTRFLWNVARLDLRLSILHPDRRGGLGFLVRGNLHFLYLVLAISTDWAFILGDVILRGQTTLYDLRYFIAGVIVFAVLIMICPLLVLTPNLVQLRNMGVFRFRGLAARYVREFEAKWLSGPLPDEALLGSADIQSLADLDGSFGIIAEQQTVVFNRRFVMNVVLAAAIPFLPLLLTVIPFDELLNRLAGFVV